MRLFRRSRKPWAPKAAKAVKSPKKPRSRREKRIRRMILSVVLLVIIALGFYLRATFSERIRSHVIAELELVTGGKVEVDSLNWKLSKLEFDVNGLTVHGKEPAGQAPYIHADHMFLQVRFSSLFSRAIRLRYIAIDHPVIHLILNPDGTTNQPEPPISNGGGLSAAAQLFELAVERFDVRNGELLLNEKKLPFEFAADSVAAAMSYSAKDKTYDGSLAFSLNVTPTPHGTPRRGTFELLYLLHPTSADIKSLKLNVGRSTLQAHGSVADYSSPDIWLHFDSSVDLADAARAMKFPQVQAGRLDVNGAAAYHRGQYSVQGNMAVHKLGWRDASFHVADVEISSPFSLTPEKFAMPHLVAHAFGGSAQGDAEAVNWTLRGPEKPDKQQQGSVNLKVQGLQVHPIAAAVSSARMPWEKLNVAGAVFGDIKVSWSGPPLNAVTTLALDVNPPAKPVPSQIPLTARLQATYHSRGEYLEVTALNAATPDMRLNATGKLGSQTTQLKVAFNADTLRELQPTLDAISSDAFVLAVLGRASFNGTVFGKLAAPSAKGRVDLANFDMLFSNQAPQLPPGSSVIQRTRGVRSIHWDSGVADITYTPSQLSAQNGILRRGAAQVAFSGSASLNRGRFNSNTNQISWDLSAQNENLADIQALVGLSTSMGGVVNGSVHGSGTLNDLRGGGNIQITQLQLWGEPFRLLRADMSLNGSETRFSNILLTHNGSQMTGSAAYNFASTAFQFDVKGTNIELADFRRFISARFTMTGNAGFHATGSGTTSAPIINGEADLRQLVWNGEQVGDLHASVETKGTDMALRARSNFENASLLLDGNIHLRDNFPAQLTLKFERFDIDPIIRAYFQGRLTGHSTMAGTIDVRGPLGSLNELTIAGTINQLSADVENIKMQNSGPIRFSVANKVVHVDQLHLSGEDTDLSISGAAQLDGPRALDLRAEGRTDLRLFQGYNPGMVSSGMATLTLNLRGTVSQPQMHGGMEIKNGAVSIEGLPNGLSQINGRLTFAQDRMQIEDLTAHSGGGALALGGFIAYRNGLYFDVTATGKDVRLRYPPGISASADARLRYTGSAQSSLLSGDITILRFAMSPHFDFVQYLARSKSAMASSTQNPFLDNMRLDIRVLSTPELRVETSLAKLSGDANLRIRGTVANPGVLGRVNIAEGDIFFNGTRYRLQRGDVTFSNPLVIQPVIDVEMAARVRDYEITIGFHGSFDRLNVTYRSDPPLPSGDIIALLAFGRTRQESVYTSRTTQPLDAPSAVVLDEALSGATTSRVQKIFGVSRIKIDPQAGGPENNPNTRVTIEQQINNNLTLTYLTNLAQSQSQQVIQVEYNINRNLSVVAVRDQNGILGFDVHFRQRKK